MRTDGMAVVCVLVAAALALSGCTHVFGTSTRDFSPVEVPVWEPGFEWTYQSKVDSVFAVAKEASEHSQSRTDSFETRFWIFNTTAPLGEEAVYYMAIDGQMTDPWFGGRVQALTQADLTIAGISWSDPPVPSTSPAPSDEDAWEDAYCASPSSWITPLPAAQRMTLLDFPLANRKAWSGVVAEQTVPMSYAGLVRGMAPVETPAGTFDAVHVVVEVKADVPPVAEENGFQVQGRYELWYAPDVKWFVKRTIALEARGFEDGERFEAALNVQTELVDYALTPGPSLPAPSSEPSVSMPVASPHLGVGTDTQFPVNLAGSSHVARFALVAISQYKYGVEEPAYRPTFPEASALSADEYAVRWTAEPIMGSGDPVTADGPVFTLEIERGGQYRVSADVRRLSCDVPSVPDTDAYFTTFWEQEFVVDVPSGASGPVSVGPVPVDSHWAEGEISWTMEPTYVVPVDGGKPLLTGPQGQDVDAYPSGSSAAYFQTYWEGTHQLSWDPDFIAVGDDVRLTVRVDYPVLW